MAIEEERMRETAVLDLWDGERHVGPSRIRWDDGVVREVAPARGTARYGVVPGLIDTHVHLIGRADGGRDFWTWPLVTRPEERVLHGLANARRAAAAGVTTLRDLSADDLQFSLRRALDDGVVDGPRLIAYGMVGMTGGHADLFVPPAFPLRPPTADGPDECRRLVRTFARAGADGIKIATSGGVLSLGDEAARRNHTREEIEAIVDEAHALRMPVAAHAHSAEGIGVALAAGVDSIEHGTLMTAEQAGRAAAAGVTVAPTLLINERIAAGGDGVPEEQRIQAAGLVAERDAGLSAAAGRGVDFVLGTDANGFHVAFGEEFAELGRMAAVLGWPAERTLMAATSRAARAVRRRELGRLEPDAAADFVVVDGRPWEDLDALHPDRIVAVVCRGRVIAGSLPA